MTALVYKMYCVVSAEALSAAGGNRGKMMAQAGHAFLHSWWEAWEHWSEDAQEYHESGQAFKITLIVDTTAELIELEKTYREICATSLVKDAGRTVFNEPTITCLGIGPIRSDKIGADLKQLRLLI